MSAISRAEVNGHDDVIVPFPEDQAQLEMRPIFDQVKQRYQDFTRPVSIELDRRQVDSLANMVCAHKAGQFFYSCAGHGMDVLEEIVREWVRKS